MTARDGGETPTLGPLPEEVASIFRAERREALEQYAQMLATDGVVRGLIGPREVPRLWERHLLNSGLLIPELDEGVSVCDVGSGAGLPGMVVAIARPDLEVTLVEPLLRRTTFLQEVAEALELSNVEVVRGRAESLHGSRQFDVVTSRAVAPLERLLGWSMPLVAPHGEMLALKGSSVGDEIETAAPVLRQFDCAPPEVVVLGEGVVESPTHAVRVRFRTPEGMPSNAAKAAGSAASNSGRRVKRVSRKQPGHHPGRSRRPKGR